MKIKIALLMIIIFLVINLFFACENNPSNEIITIKFNNDFQYKKYDGKQIIIRGYMSTLSPISGKYMYLMNIPYQSCPFCMPNSNTIVNTVAVYAPTGKIFDFYDGPIEIIGTLKIGDVTDDFGYQYPFKIVEAKYIKIDTSQLSENLKIYGALSMDGIINDIMKLTGQVDFNAYFEMYNATKNDIKTISNEDFDKIIKRIKAISVTDYTDIIGILEDFKMYNDNVNKNIALENYDKNCTIEMEEKIISLYNKLFTWLNKFEI